MQLDVDRDSRIAVAGFNDIRIQRALGKELRAFDRLGLAIERFDEFVADDFPLQLRIDHALKLTEKPFAGVVDAQLDLEVISESRFNQLALVFSEQAIVNEDADELLADRF